ncbi:MAG: response regulator [Armatimonadetes bacterium]|nr:response regulator [Armatimonadota bacterium]
MTEGNRGLMPEARWRGLPELREPVRVLVVDDKESIRSLIGEALVKQDYYVAAVAHGREAIDLLSVQSFDIVLTDLMMPTMSGVELVPEMIRDHPEMPVVVITGFGDVRTTHELMDMGASDFIMKPFRLSELPIIIERNLRRKRRERRHDIEHRQLIHRAYDATLDALLKLLEVRDTETEGHSERVTAYTMALAATLDIVPSRFPTIERGALLHDVGKIGIRDSILHKPGPLTEEEWRIMKEHPLIGHRMIYKIEFLKESAPIILSHHERWDGKGYPQGLQGEEIPLEARIFAVADAFDAMTSPRPYKAALPFEDALLEIARCRGGHFDPLVVDAFLSIPERHWIDIARYAKG